MGGGRGGGWGAGPAGPHAARRPRPRRGDRGQRLVDRVRGRRGTGHRLCVSARRWPAPARPPVALPAAGHPRSVPRGRSRGVRLDRRGLARGAAARLGAVRMPHRDVLRRGHVRRGDRAPGAPGRPWRRRHRADAGGRVLRIAGLGLRRRGPVRPAPRLRRSGRAQAARRRRARPRAWRGAWTWSTTTSARPGTTCRSSGPTSPPGTGPTGAKRSTSTGPAATRSGAS